MKKLFKLFTLAIVVFAMTFTTSSCKKGENDPGISLRSRTARLSGEWTLAEFDYTSTSKSSGKDWNDDTYTRSSTSTSKFDGTTRTYTSTSVYNGETSTYSDIIMYSETITIESDGTFKIKTVTTDDGDVSTRTTEGDWIWLKGNDEKELSNKEAVLFTPTKESNVSTYNGSTSTSSSTYGGKNLREPVTYIIDRLANDELIILIDSENTSNSGTYSSSSTTKGTKRYTQK